MTAYEKFKSSLAYLCERGKINKSTKKRLSRFNTDGGELVYRVCTELAELFNEAPKDSSDYREAVWQVVSLVSEIGCGMGLKRDAAVVCAFLKLTADANRTGNASIFSKLKKHAQEYNESLQNIKHDLPLFGEVSLLTNVDAGDKLKK